jgi:hypothetical protein
MFLRLSVHGSKPAGRIVTRTKSQVTNREGTHSHIVASCLVTGEFSVYSWLIRASLFLPAVWFRGVQHLQLADMEGGSLLPAV